MAKTETTRRGGSGVHRLEADLVDELVSRLPAYVRRASRTCTVHREVGVGKSIVDVVAALMPASVVRVPPTLTAQESVVVSTLRCNGSTRVDVLERLCGMPALSLRNGVVARLSDAGVVARGRGGRVALGRWCRAGSLIAIEAKLTRWLEALDQAVEYRQFADRVYVALPSDCIGPALKARAKFERASVGLLSVSGGLKCEIRAPALTTHDWRREFVYSRLASIASDARSRSAY